jgi:hypothetical protein
LKVGAFLRGSDIASGCKWVPLLRGSVVESGCVAKRRMLQWSGVRQ